MIGKEAHSITTVSALNKTHFVGPAVTVYQELPGKPNSTSVDPIGQLKANIRTLNDLTSELSFMVKEIGSLTKKS
jgi:hypothetical protein